jgi:hypothetical protein
LPGKAWEFLASLPALTLAEKKTNPEVANGFIQSMKLGYCNPVSKAINAQKSGNPRLPFPHPTEAFHTQVTLVPYGALD